MIKSRFTGLRGRKFKKCRQIKPFPREKGDFTPSFSYEIWQEREDSNPRPLVLETSALTRLSYAPMPEIILVPLEGFEPPTRDLGRRRSIL